MNTTTPREAPNPELKQFTFWIKNDRTGEATQFIGQGTNVADAFKDGAENAKAHFGTSSSGAPPISLARLAVRLRDGRRVFRAWQDFEGSVPYSAATEDKPAPTGGAS